MTGYSRSQADFEWGSVTIEISSVNHKYQDVSIRLPREFSTMEPVLQKRFRSAFKRGKAVLRCDVCWSASCKACSIKRDILGGYVGDLRSAIAELNLDDSLRIDALLNLPGVLEPSSAPDATSLEKVEDHVLAVLETVLEDWLAMKQKEGLHLEKNIIDHLEKLEVHLETIRTHWPRARISAIESFRERIRTLLEAQHTAPDDSRIAQEVVILSDKWDISEEIARLDSHVAKFREIMDNVEVSGKKLDFLVQEMNREINTIASKSNDSTLRWEAVEAKSELESMREQIQNVE